jgi:dCMP deaminase
MSDFQLHQIFKYTAVFGLHRDTCPSTCDEPHWTTTGVTVPAEAAGLPRPGWDDYFLGIAQVVASRGECLRSRVGAVIVRDNRILATGYNGVAAGEMSCLDGICPRQKNNVPSSAPYSGAGECIAIHAEDNAVTDALRRGIDVESATIYVTKEPCERCDVLLAALNMTVVWPGGWAQRSRPPG